MYAANSPRAIVRPRKDLHTFPHLHNVLFATPVRGYGEGRRFHWHSTPLGVRHVEKSSSNHCRADDYSRSDKH